MLEYHQNILCVSGGWLYKESSLLTKSNYDSLKKRGWITVVRSGGNGRTALVEYDSLRDDIKKGIIELVGDPYKKVKMSQFDEKLEPDYEAEKYYSTFKLPNGKNLPADKQKQYRINAEILNAVHEMVKTTTAKRKALGGSTAKIWDKMAELINGLDTNKHPHTLPSNPRRLQMRYKTYRKDGLLCLVHKNYCNDNSRKVTAELERLIMSLYVMPNKPYTSDVHELYLSFLGRAIEVFDYRTGEVFNPDHFRNDKGEVITVSEATVYHYLNMPHNQIVLAKHRAGSLEFSTLHRPHHNRHSPTYSLSKISMDDRDLPRKMLDGKRVKAYYAYDVASGCVIGASYSKKKDSQLFVECMRNMFRFLDSEGLGTPLQVEVEHHLVVGFKDGLMKAENVFRFVRWGNPGNAQEKHAENFHRVKKYGYEKKYQNGIGRFYSKLEANRVHQDKIFDADNDNYKEDLYSFEQLVADDRQIIELYNNDSHPNQKKYPGKSRMDVLLLEANPEVLPLEPYKLALYIGDSVTTTIRRSQYVQVQYGKYQIPNIEALERLKSGSTTVEAYYLPEANGAIDKVYLYQDGLLICACDKITTYNTANSEWTDEDQTAYQDQAKYVSSFDAHIKTKALELSKVAVSRELIQDIPEEPVEIIHEEPIKSNSNDFNNYDPSEVMERAKSNL